MEHMFFKPFIGSSYEQGICGKKVLVLGASFYCNKDGKNERPKCEFFEECTNPDIKDSSKFNVSCPFNVNIEGTPKLRDEPTNSVWSYMRAYQNFAKVLLPYIKDKEKQNDWCDYDIVWDRIAFTNYVQFFLPTVNTYQCYLSQRDFEAFCECLQELKPDIVIAWGVAITEEIRSKNQFVSQMELDKLPESDYYVWHMKLPEVNHDITIINCYHPSSKKWNENEEKEVFLKHLNKVFMSK